MDVGSAVSRKLQLLAILLVLFLLVNCGGASMGGGSSSGSPIANLSSTNLTFGDEVVGTASQAQPITLANSGTVSTLR